MGKNILGSGFDLEMYVHISAGRYMCGEETGLLNALGRQKGQSTSKAAIPPGEWLFGKPTIVNNVETLCNMPYIINNGAEWFKDLSNSDEGGTKLYGVSGKVKNPGCWELPLGTTMREIIEEHAGGMKDGYRSVAFCPAALPPISCWKNIMDIAMDFATVAKAGSRLGTGTMIVLDDQTCPVGFVHNLEHFFAQESCGWCTPCRDGLPWVAKILNAIEEGQRREG